MIRGKDFLKVLIFVGNGSMVKVVILVKKV